MTSTSLALCNIVWGQRLHPARILVGQSCRQAVTGPTRRIEFANRNETLLIAFLQLVLDAATPLSQAFEHGQRYVQSSNSKVNSRSAGRQLGSNFAPTPVAHYMKTKMAEVDGERTCKGIVDAYPTELG